MEYFTSSNTGSHAGERLLSITSSLGGSLIQLVAIARIEVKNLLLLCNASATPEHYAGFTSVEIIIHYTTSFAVTVMEFLFVLCRYRSNQSSYSYYGVTARIKVPRDDDTIVE